MAEYDVAQFCEDGHLITERLGSHPERGRKFCEKCGAPTLSACPQCNANIPGELHGRDVIQIIYRRPAFCGECGAPYSWTNAAKEEWKGLAELVEGLSAKEREQLAASVDDLIADTPRTEGAVARLRLLFPRVRGEAWAAMRTILVTVATAAVKKELDL